MNFLAADQTSSHNYKFCFTFTLSTTLFCSTKTKTSISNISNSQHTPITAMLRRRLPVAQRFLPLSQGAAVSRFNCEMIAIASAACRTSFVEPSVDHSQDENSNNNINHDAAHQSANNKEFAEQLAAHHAFAAEQAAIITELAEEQARFKESTALLVVNLALAVNIPVNNEKFTAQIAAKYASATEMASKYSAAAQRAAHNKDFAAQRAALKEFSAQRAADNKEFEALLLAIVNDINEKEQAKVRRLMIFLSVIFSLWFLLLPRR